MNLFPPGQRLAHLQRRRRRPRRRRRRPRQRRRRPGAAATPAAAPRARGRRKARLAPRAEAPARLARPAPTPRCLPRAGAGASGAHPAVCKPGGWRASQMVGLTYFPRADRGILRGRTRGRARREKPRAGSGDTGHWTAAAASPTAQRCQHGVASATGVQGSRRVSCELERAGESKQLLTMPPRTEQVGDQVHALQALRVQVGRAADARDGVVVKHRGHQEERERGARAARQRHHCERSANSQ